MDQLSVLYTNIWCVTIASLLFYIIHEDAEYQKLLQKESKTEYFPLDFKSCNTFQFVEVNDKLEESTNDPIIISNKSLVLNQNGYVVIDQDGVIRYKFIRARKTLMSEYWKMFEIPQTVARKQLSINDDFIALIHVNSKWSIFKKDILFPMKIYKRQSAIGNDQLESEETRQLSLLSQPISELSSNLNHSSPYVEPVIQNNSYIKKSQLCEEITYNPHPTLHLTEERKMSRIHVKYFHKYKTGFKIQKNSDFQYNWIPNGYLEKTLVQKEKYATERIGYMKVDKSHVKLYINERMIETEVATATSFLQYILDYK